METKECKTCHAIKPINEFYKNQCIRMGMTVPVDRAEVNNVKREGKIKRTNSYRIVP